MQIRKRIPIPEWQGWHLEHLRDARVFRDWHPSSAKSTVSHIPWGLVALVWPYSKFARSCLYSCVVSWLHQNASETLFCPIYFSRDQLVLSIKNAGDDEEFILSRKSSNETRNDSRETWMVQLGFNGIKRPLEGLRSRDGFSLDSEGKTTHLRNYRNRGLRSYVPARGCFWVFVLRL